MQISTVLSCELASIVSKLSILDSLDMQYLCEPTSPYVSEGFLAPLEAYVRPLVGVIQIHGCDDR